MQLIDQTHSPRSRGRTSRRCRAVLALGTSALLSLAATACGSDSVGPLGGSGTLTATGAVTASGTGLAIFETVMSGGASLFQMVVVPVSQTTASSWQLQIASYSGRLAAGTYTLSALDPTSANPTANFYYSSATGLDSYNSTAGQLVITSSSPTLVRGTFTFTGTNVSGGTGSVTVTGSFTAPCAPDMACQ